MTQYAITNGSGSTLAANLGTGDVTMTTIGAMAGADHTSRYNVIIGSEILGVTHCDGRSWTVLERGVTNTPIVTHPLGAGIFNRVEADYLQHLAAPAAPSFAVSVSGRGGRDVASKLYLSKNFT